ncbi:MAG: PQQ-binding-like beta-propeller repeat protein [Candidatus Micrarchaeota archaeon]
MKKALLLLLLASLSYSSLVWQFATDGPISYKPLIYQGAVVFASDDGNIYALDPTTGARRWSVPVGKTPAEPVMADNAIYVPLTSGKVVKLGPNGQVQWTADLTGYPYNITYLYGVSVTPKTVFVTASNGVYALDKNGSVRARFTNYTTDATLTAPASGADYVVFGKGRELIRMSETGQVQWKAALAEGNFWLSRPTIEGNVVYVGSLDDRMHAFVVTNGLELWNIRAKNWVAGTPLASGGTVYFGANDGNVYAVEGADGTLKWIAPTQLAVISQPEIGTMGGKEVVFAGGSDKNIYAISRDSGEVVWKGPAAGAVGSPLFYQNKVIVGAADGKVYAYSTERACSITFPLEADVVGLKELVVRGKYASETGGAKVLVQINEGQWQDAQTGDVDWTFIVNPKASLAPGLNTISCQVSDAGGSEEGPTYTSVAIAHDPNAPVSNLFVSVSPNIVEGKPFTIYVNDADDGSAVDRFNLSVADKFYQADKNYTLTIDQAGTYTATVRKIGFNDATVTVTVNAAGVNPFYVGGGVLLILIIVWQLWTRVFRQRFAARRK